MPFAQLADDIITRKGLLMLINTTPGFSVKVSVILNSAQLVPLQPGLGAAVTFPLPTCVPPGARETGMPGLKNTEFWKPLDWYTSPAR